MTTNTGENASANNCPAKNSSIRNCKVVKRTRSSFLKIVAAEPSSEPIARAVAMKPHVFSSNEFMIHVGPALPRKPLTREATNHVPSPTCTQRGNTGEAFLALFILVWTEAASVLGEST